MAKDPETRRVVELEPTSQGTVERPPQGSDPLTLRSSREGRVDPTLVDGFRTLIAERWLILAVASAVVGVAIAYLYLAMPVYRSSAVVQAEEEQQALPGLEELAALGGSAPAEAQIEVIRSRTIIGAVVDELKLDVVATPRRAPLFGAAIARRYHGDGPARPWLGMASFGWGGERVHVEKLDVSDELVEDEMTVTVLEGGRYRVSPSDGAVLVEGAVGETARGGDGGRKVELLVTELVARPGSTFLLVKRHRDNAIDEVRRQLVVEQKGRNTGVLVLSSEHPDPAQVATILNAVASRYLKYNVERKSAEAQRTLEFLETQLPILKASVDKAEAALNAFLEKKGTVNTEQEAVAMLERQSEVERMLAELQLQQADLRQRFTTSHPMLASVVQRMEKLREKRAEMDARKRELPETERAAARLTRDLTVASELYVMLLNKAQEIKVMKSGVVGNVTILDDAPLPRRPAWPRKGMVLTLALMLGLGTGIAVALARRAFAEGVEDPEDIEAGTGLPVYATVPHSEREEGLDRGSRGFPGHVRLPLVVDASDDLAIESLRSLRTALQFALIEAGNNIIAMGAPTPRVGKSFVSVNLACLLAAPDRRVLLVDADLRRGRLHRFFTRERQPGLSDAISGTAALDDTIRNTGYDNLHILPTGRIPPNPAELLGSHRFQQILTSLSQRYDLVLIDTPPVLAVTDPALVARWAGVNLFVVRAGRNPVREIDLALHDLARAGVRVQGAILNGVRASRGRYGRHGRYSRYEYRSERNA